MTVFNPNNVGQPNGNYFALPYSLNEATIALISVPWDVTASFRAGTAAAPFAIIDASAQVDLFDADINNAWEIQIGTVPFNEQLSIDNKKYRTIAEKIITSMEQGISQHKLSAQLVTVNEACAAMNKYVYDEANKQLSKQRIAAVVGGEHNAPTGLLQALSKHYNDFGILHIDAHADLRKSYEGFEFSHASVMYNALQLSSVRCLTQVAVRDYCHDEAEFMKLDSRIITFTDNMLHEAAFNGKTWTEQTAEILKTLPYRVYISFDIDGLSPEYCSNTGTPVPGGLSYSQAVYLLKQLALSGRRIIGFDLCETAADGNDANIAARLLYKLCCYTHIAAIRTDKNEQ